MPDIATISAFLGSIKTATDLAKAIKLSDSSLEKAELKLKIAELMESLANVKIQAVEIKELIQEKDAEIKQLKNLIETKSSEKNKMPNEAIEILKLLGSANNAVVDKYLLEQAGFSIQKGRYFLEILEEKEFIDCRYWEYDQDLLICELTFKGREYLFKNGFL